MRGTLLAVVAVAVIAGLGVVALVRATGWLSPAPVAVVEPVVVVPVAPPAPQVVVAARHLFENDTISPPDIKLRAVRPEEMKDFQERRADYLAAADIAYFRFAARDVISDTPLRRADLQELKKPEPLNARLAPGTRAVDLPIPRELAAGGMIAVGDWVDVYILTDVARTDNPARVPQNGVLVQSAPVIAKRGTLFSIFAPLPPGEPIAHTLAVNPYRAALLDYARAVGALSLVPVSAGEKRRLDDLKAKVIENPERASLAIPFAEPGSPEFVAEAERIEKYNRGEVAVGRADLARVLRLTPPPPPPPAVRVELVTGVRPTGVATFAATDPPPPPEYLFTAPTGPDGRPVPGSTVRPVAVPPKN